MVMYFVYSFIYVLFTALTAKQFSEFFEMPFFIVVPLMLFFGFVMFICIGMIAGEGKDACACFDCNKFTTAGLITITFCFFSIVLFVLKLGIEELI